MSLHCHIQWLYTRFIYTFLYVVYIKFHWAVSWKSLNPCTTQNLIKFLLLKNKTHCVAGFMQNNVPLAGRVCFYKNLCGNLLKHTSKSSSNKKFNWNSQLILAWQLRSCHNSLTSEKSLLSVRTLSLRRIQIK